MRIRTALLCLTALVVLVGCKKKSPTEADYIARVETTR